MNTTITEKYALCMLKEKRNLYGSELPYLVMSMLVEMMLYGNLEITANNQVIIKNELVTSEYNRRLCEFLKAMKKEKLYLKDIVTTITNGFSNKKLRGIIELLQDGMINKKLLGVVKKKGILGAKKTVVVNEDKFVEIITEVRAGFLEQGNLEEDIILLGALLNSSKILKNIFTKYEKEVLNQRLQEIKTTEIADKVKVVQTVIDDMTVLIASIAIFAAID